MAVTTEAPRVIAQCPDMVVSLGFVGWEGLEAVAKLTGDRRNPRVFYSEGYLTLMTPSWLHEQDSGRLDQVVRAICYELTVNLVPAGSTLYKRRDIDRGIMPDQSYYLEREASVRGLVGELDLDLYPPPDLIIEVEATHPATASLATCQALGVPEVWVYNTRLETIRVLLLDGTGVYLVTESSRAFPFLRGDEILPWITSDPNEERILWERRLREWIREVLGPRRNP